MYNSAAFRFGAQSWGASGMSDGNATTGGEGRPAGFWIRVVAYIIDGIILNVVNGILFGIAGVNVFALDTGSPEAAGSAAGVIGLILVVVNLGYFVVLEASKLQATLGKLVVGIRVSDANGQRIGIGRSIGRTLAKIVSYIVLLIGFIMVAFTDRKRGLHDMLAGTLVHYRS